LDYVLKKLEFGCIANASKLKRSTKSSENMSSVLQLAEKAICDYLKNESVLAKNNLDLVMNQARKYFAKDVSSNSLKSIAFDSITSSPIQKKYILMIQSIVADRTLNIDSCLAKIKNIENIVRTECSEKEGAAVLSTAAIARHSMQYWHDNHLKWITKLRSTVVRPLKMNKLKSTKKNGSHLPDGYHAWPDDPHMYILVVNGYVTLMYCPPGMVFDPDTKTCKFEEKEKSFNLNQIAATDVIAGATAAVGTWYLNVVIGPGNVAYGGVVGVAALSGSVGAGLMGIYLYFR
jgi:hypothetical protein